MSYWRYQQYIKSGAWQQRKASILMRAKGKCERCHASNQRLEVHHKTYKNLFHELDHELIAVCSTCHKELDSKREQAKYQAAVDTYATKKYGEDWEYYKDPEDVEEEFENWRERKESDGEWD